MAGAQDPLEEGPKDDFRYSAWQRFRLRKFENRAPLSIRLQNAMLKPRADGEPTPTAPQPETVEEFEAAVKSMDDKERLIGLIAAPVAAGISFVIAALVIDDDPPATLSNGQPNKLHVAVSLYHELELVLLALSVGMLICSMLRKRLYLGMVMALFGLTIFNLHQYGFGLPFLAGGAWYLVRAYRLQRGLREASGETPRRGGSAPSNSGRARPRPNKRYTPPAS